MKLFIAILLLCFAGGSYAGIEKVEPFTKQQMDELYNLIQKGAALKQVQALMDRKEGSVWSYKSNSGTMLITVHTWRDKWGRSVNGHFNRDNIMVYGSHDVTTFMPLKDPGEKARKVRKEFNL